METLLPWEKAYRHWRKLADAGYSKRVVHVVDMQRVDERIRKAKEKYERLLAASKR